MLHYSIMSVIQSSLEHTMDFKSHWKKVPQSTKLAPNHK